MRMSASVTSLQKMQKGKYSDISKICHVMCRSTAVELALKMAFRLFLVDHPSVPQETDLGVLGLEGAYHGDTLGAMDAVAPSIYNARQTPWCRSPGTHTSLAPSLPIPFLLFHVFIPLHIPCMMSLVPLSHASARACLCLRGSSARATASLGASWCDVAGSLA